MFITNLIRILLFAWIISILLRWLRKGRPAEQKKASGEKTSAGGGDSLSDIPVRGDIEDADFEEIDDR